MSREYCIRWNYLLLNIYIVCHFSLENFCLFLSHLEALKILEKYTVLIWKNKHGCHFLFNSFGPNIIFSIITISEINLHESCYETIEQKWIKVNKKREILGNIHVLTICYMFALKSKVNLKKCATKVCTHDAYTVLLVLKLGLVVVVIVIITILHQVFISPYKPTTVPILS